MATSHDHLDKLLDTARSGDLEQFRRLVSETMCINEIHPITHETILEMLAREGLAEFVLYAVDQGASHWAACRGAAEGGHQALMNELLRRGAPKHFAVRGAARGGHTELMWSLIRNGAPIGSALWGASENGDPSVIEALLQKGANPCYALFGAIACGDQVRIRASMSYTKNPQAIQIAALYGQIRLLDELKTHCIDHDTPELVPYYVAEGGFEIPFLERYGENSEYLAWGIRGAAKGGHVNFLNKLTQHATQKALLNQKTALIWAVTGAAIGNHSKLVDDLISRGANLEDALLGAAIIERQALMDRLIAQGKTSGLLRKDIAVRAAAISRRYDDMNDWLIDGANVNEALRGICFRGVDLELAKRLLSKGASPEWGLLGYYEGYREECYSKNQQFSDLLESYRVKYFRASIKIVAENGWLGSFQTRLMCLEPPQCDYSQEILNAAVTVAARVGFRTNVTVLLKMGASLGSALEGAVKAGDRDLLESLVRVHNPPSDPLQTFFKTAFAMHREDLVEWMLQRLGRRGAEECAVAIKRMENPHEVVKALSQIANPDQQLKIAEKANFLDMVRPAQIARTVKVSPHIALVARKINGASLRYLSTLCFLNKPSIPKDAVKKLLSYVVATDGHQIPEREIPALMRASHFANSPEMRAEVSSPASCCIL